MNISFPCAVCEHPGHVRLPDQRDWQCPQCDQLVHVEPADAALTHCAICDCHELYKKKDFPQKLGMGVLVVACIASSIATLFYQWYLTWAILIGSAAFDGILYLLVKDAIVCYRCHALYRGIAANAQHQPFELTVFERYRQEKLRRQELQKAAGAKTV